MNILALPFGVAELRDYEPLLRALAKRGQRIEVALAPGEKESARALIQQIRVDHPQIDEVSLRARRGWWWPVADTLRSRAACRNGRSERSIRLLERSLPADPGLLDFLRRSLPDVVLVIGDAPGAGIADIIKAARQLSCRTVLAIGPGQTGTVQAVAADRTVTWPSRNVDAWPLEAERVAGEIEAAAAAVPKRWTNPAGAALVRAAVFPFVAPLRRRVLERDHPDTWRGIERIDPPRYAVPVGGPAARSESELRAATRVTTKALAAIAESERPILVGPWTGRPEIELLYWIPFLQWARQAYDLATERFVVASRNGSRHWYGALAGRHVDVGDLLGATLCDEAIGNQAAERARATYDLAGMQRLPPAVMTDGLLRLHWDQRSPPDHLLLHAVYEPLPEPSAGDLENALPEDFYAVRFEEGGSIAATPENRDFVHGLLARLCAQRTVVLLDASGGDGAAGSACRPHSWLFDGPGPCRFGNRLIRAGDDFIDSDDLEFHTRIIARSRGFVGGFGVQSYLAGFLRKPSVGFHDRYESLNGADLSTASTVFRSFDVPFMALTPSDLALVRDVI